MKTQNNKTTITLATLLLLGSNFTHATSVTTNNNAATHKSWLLLDQPQALPRVCPAWPVCPPPMAPTPIPQAPIEQ